MTEFRMPALGADMEAGKLVAFRRKPGEFVQRGDIIAEVETEKGVIEVECFAAGILERYLVEPGTKVPVGTPLALLRAQGEEPLSPVAVAAPESVPVPASTSASVPAPESVPESAPVAAAAPESVPVPASASTSAPTSRPVAAAEPRPEPVSATSGRTTSSKETPRIAPLAPPSESNASIDVQPSAPAAIQRLAGTPSARKRARESALVQPVVVARPRISPAARRRAEQLGLAVEKLRSRSEPSAITLSDVEAAAAEHRPAQATAEGPAAAMRHAIALAMARSKREIPHYYVTTTIDFSAASTWLAAHNAGCPVGERILSVALLLKAVALATQRMPEFNVHYEAGQVRACAAIHVGCAISLRGGGLVAPALHDADKLSLSALMTALDDVVMRARAGRLRSSELSDASLTVTNLGERGVESVLPIIHPPQTAIVGFGRISERPWVVAGRVVARPLVQATLAADHRVTDGHAGARYLNAIDQLLQKPEAL